MIFFLILHEIGMVISEAMPFLFCAQQQISHARLNGEII
jgi:hypothetical protein